MADLEQRPRSARRYSGDYKGWTPSCATRDGVCEEHGVRVGRSRICIVDHLQAMAQGGGANAVHAQGRLDAFHERNG